MEINVCDEFTRFSSIHTKFASYIYICMYIYIYNYLPPQKRIWYLVILLVPSGSVATLCQAILRRLRESFDAICCICLSTAVESLNRHIHIYDQRSWALNDVLGQIKCRPLPTPAERQCNRQLEIALSTNHNALRDLQHSTVAAATAAAIKRQWQRTCWLDAEAPGLHPTRGIQHIIICVWLGVCV